MNPCPRKISFLGNSNEMAAREAAELMISHREQLKAELRTLATKLEHGSVTAESLHPKLAALRDAGLGVVEALESVDHRRDYLVTMTSDLDFCADNAAVVAALGIPAELLRGNPLMRPRTLRQAPLAPPLGDDDEERRLRRAEATLVGVLNACKPKDHNWARAARVQLSQLTRRPQEFDSAFDEPTSSVAITGLRTSGRRRHPHQQQRERIPPERAYARGQGRPHHRERRRKRHTRTTSLPPVPSPPQRNDMGSVLVSRWWQFGDGPSCLLTIIPPGEGRLVVKAYEPTTSSEVSLLIDAATVSKLRGSTGLRAFVATELPSRLDLIRHRGTPVRLVLRETHGAGSPARPPGQFQQKGGADRKHSRSLPALTPSSAAAASDKKKPASSSKRSTKKTQHPSSEECSSEYLYDDDFSPDVATIG